MLIKGKDLIEYVAGHGFESAKVVRQYLRYFDCCQELREALDKLYEDWLEEQRMSAERFNFDPVAESKRVGELEQQHMATKANHVEGKSVKEKTIHSEPPRPKTIIDFCPHCGSTVHGEPIPGCEKRISGRAFYAECSACKYYYEIFEKGKKLKKVEGGIDNGRENDR